MTTDPDLAQATAARRAALVQALSDSGDLTDPAWRTAFERVPRHVFVPYFYDHTGRRISAGDAETRDAWFDAVHEDRALVTHRTGGAATSSSSQPSVMAIMLEALRVEDGVGMKVLEIGTGTGYNAALLTHRLGNDSVVTVDTEPDLIAAARARLIETGYEPHVVLADGTHGHPDLAPYDRIIATCRIDSVPPAWLRQLTDGTGSDAGQILAPLGNALVRVRRTGPLQAEGRFLPGGACFMPLRHGTADGIPTRRPALPTGKARSTDVPASALADNAYRFLLSIVEPHLDWQYDLDDAGRPTAARVWSPDWSRLEEVYRLFTEHDGPGPERYGLTVDQEAQHVWLDGPGGPCWSLRP
ncbi:methyltransferase domain-containing protein [Streptomyces sp. KAI-26]|uniref:methyltransferase domain-containing protein n=1 Tax=Streptomyces sp. KAI-26 TaxID=1169747 RepID=UPI0015870EAA|nr:methyltransferase domain-containing protein [Streptomyces sp. KAI-26]NUV87577.1 methyltransferase domain-containing protein [Streptomyces sp. KAI-26]NUW22058.1 methyltransferase domain-containing protein [Streptomyces roseoviolaceus]